MKSHAKLRVILSMATLLIVFSACSASKPEPFSGDLAYDWILRQCELGYRHTGSEGNLATGDLIIKELQSHGWQVDEYTHSYYGETVRNIIAVKGDGPALVVGTHYDTRRQADEQDPSVPVLGANDGASGTAVILELGRVLDVPKNGNNSVVLALFDAEDNGKLDGWSWIVGSTYMAENWTSLGLPNIESLVVVDMIGDLDQQIYMERYSNPDLNTELWSIAAHLGYSDRFIPEYKYPMIDDHAPFIQISEEVSLLIDFDYPYWHTTQDTPDKTSPDSLQAVGDVVLTWLNNRLGNP